MATFDPFPSLLLSIARSPVTAVGLPLAAGWLSGLSTSQGAKGLWYKSLAAPPGKPASAAFPIVWSGLYLGMGYASHLAVRAFDLNLTPASQADAALGLKLYYAQLGLNLAYMPLFFAAKRPGLALTNIGALTGIVAYMTKLLHGPTDGVSSYFLVPYTLWLGYATYLNAGIWFMNRNRYIPKQD